MPKNPMTDPITDQEIAFARLILSGTMTDRRAAETVGLNPSTAAYTKSKPRVRDYMIEHRAAVNKKLADDEAEAVGNQHRSRDQIRDQILDRLWHLANINPEQTRGSIAGQIKAMAMIVAIEGLIPNRPSDRHAQATPAAPPVKAQIYISERMRQPAQPEANEPPRPNAALEEQPALPEEPEHPASPTQPGNELTPNQVHPSPAIHPERTSWVPDAMGATFDADFNRTGPFKLPIPPGKSAMARNR